MKGFVPHCTCSWNSSYPNGLSKRQPQPGDKKKPEDNFKDWIDNVDGFLHFLNPHPAYIKTLTHTLPIASYIHSYSNTTVKEQLAKQQEENNLIPFPEEIQQWQQIASQKKSRLG